MLRNAEDYELQRLCELRQNQFSLACRILELEHAPGSDPERALLPDLHTSLDFVNSKLQEQQEQQAAPSAGQGSGH